MKLSSLNSVEERNSSALLVTDADVFEMEFACLDVVTDFISLHTLLTSFSSQHILYMKFNIQIQVWQVKESRIHHLPSSHFRMSFKSPVMETITWKYFYLNTVKNFV